MDVQKVKRCGKCREIKPITEFWKNKAQTSGYCGLCIKCHREHNKKSYFTHRKERLQTAKNWVREIKKEWTIYLNSKNPNPKCEICGRKLEYLTGIRENSVHFDHKDEHSEILDCPSSWLQRHPCNEKYKGIWGKSNFGILCHKCNKNLPTVNRKKWFINSLKYIYGSNYHKFMTEIEK